MRTFLLASSILCFLLAVFAGRMFLFGDRLTRSLGLVRFADFRKKLWPVLGPIARILLALVGIGILFFLRR